LCHTITLLTTRSRIQYRETTEGFAPSCTRGFALAINEGEETARILSILEEARGLSDVEFELQKSDLVQQVKSAYELPQALVDVCLKIERHLLDPRIIPLLEEKLTLTQ
jgi:hypothetical protein